MASRPWQARRTQMPSALVCWISTDHRSICFKGSGRKSPKLGAYSRAAAFSRPMTRWEMQRRDETQDDQIGRPGHQDPQDQAGRSPPGRVDGRRRETVPGQGRRSDDDQRDRRGSAGRQGHVLSLLRVQERNADGAGRPLHGPVPGTPAGRRGRLPANDWRTRLQTWIRVNVEAYVETYRTHDIVYTNHHHHDRSNQDKNAILDQLLDIIENGIAAGTWTADQPGSWPC